MKRTMVLVLLCLWAISISACSHQKGQDYLNGKVLEITETEIIVECIDESSDGLTGTRIGVSKEVISGDGIPMIEVGNEIRVVYDFSKVQKSGDPVKIPHVYAIYLLDEHGEAIPN